MKYRLLPLWALLFAVLVPGAFPSPVFPAQAPETDSQATAEPSGPRAVGQPSALDQVENWINQNVDSSEQNATATAPVAAPLAGLTREADMAQVDWGSGNITALGVADAPGDGLNPARAEALAIRKATMQARKQLQDAVFALPLDGRHLVGDALSAQQRTDLRGKLQNSPITRRTEPDGLGGVRVEVRAEVSLRGALAEALIPPTVAFQSRIPPQIELTAEVAGGPTDVDQLEYRQSMAELGAFTGLVVDARGFDCAPALLPVVTGPDGKAAFGPFLASRALVLEEGLAVYAHSPQDPAAKRRVGGTPLVVRVLAVSGPQRADLVISSADAELVRVLFRAEGMTERCPVAIVMD
ncbi:MAG: hypothetical protein AB7E32_13810 [Desulfovibrio sp.]